VQGGMHSVAAAKKCKAKFDRREIDAALYDSRWVKFPCRLYLFKEGVEEVKDIVSVLGQEDNEDYKMVYFSNVDVFVADPFL
jgi:hypothetical protein